MPKVEASGLYNLQMMLGVLNIKGEGNMRAYLGEFLPRVRTNFLFKTKFQLIDNLKLKISISGPTLTKNGQQFLRVDKCQVGVKIVSLKLNFENLFRGDKVLSDLGNSLVNQNIDMFIRDIEPALQKSLCKSSFLRT